MQKINSEVNKKPKNPARAKNATKMLTYTAVLVALSVICNIFDVPLGIGDLKITFSYIPNMVAGIFLGPIAGLCVGLIGDVLGLLIMPQGAWIPYITVGSALMGLIPGLIFKIKLLNPYIKLAISLLLAFLICTCGINSLGIFLFFLKGKKTFWAFMATRIPVQALIFAVNSCLLFLLYRPLKKFVFSKTNFVKNHDVNIVTNEDIKNEVELINVDNNDIALNNDSDQYLIKNEINVEVESKFKNDIK